MNTIFNIDKGLIILIVSLLITNVTAFAQQDVKLLRDGNNKYLDREFEEAELSYRKSLDENADREESIFNLGNALYQQERYKDAIVRYEESIKDLEDDEERSSAYHNLGNSLLSEVLKKIDSQQPVVSDSLNASINAFKEVLKLNPKDQDARYNLTYAQFIKSKLKKQENDSQCNNPQQSEDGEKQENKDQEKKEQEKQENKEQENENKEEEEKAENEEEKEEEEGEEKEEEQPQEEEQDEQAQNEEGEEEEEEQPQPEEGEEQPEEQPAQDQQIEQAAEPKELSEEEAERLLEALLNEEMKVQEKILKAKMPKQRKNIEKDW